MTTKPKAKKFRIRRSAAVTFAPPSSAAAATQRSAAEAAAPAPVRPTPANSLRAAPDAARPETPRREPTPGPRAEPVHSRETGAPAAARPAAEARRDIAPPGDDDPLARQDRARAIAQLQQARAQASLRPEPAAPAQVRPAASRLQLTGQVSSARETAAETDIEAIRREGLTGRQLRMARRVAQKHNLPATSDFDAVRLLRERGIDPFQRSNMLELVVPKSGGGGQDGGGAGVPARRDDPADRLQLPQTVPAKKVNLPSTELSPAQQRSREIGEIQRDIMLRRRRKMILLAARLAFFVGLPTLIAGWYFYFAATPMYSTKAEFFILQADGAGGKGLGGLFSGTQFATNQDSIGVQSFLQSKEAMLRLDGDDGFKAEFQHDWIDPIQRLAPDATNEDAYKLYKKYVKIGYDPTEGVIRMEVTAPDPLVATEFSRRLISYAEQRVNHMSEQKRADQMHDALESFENAQKERRAAQEALVELQQKSALLDPEGAITTLRGQINGIEVQLQEKELELAALNDNARPNQAKVQGVEGDIRRLKDLLDRLNQKMTEASEGENSLAQLTVQIQMAKADLATRDMLLQSSLQQLEQTRTEANRQVRYLTTSVMPVPSESPSYPRKFENTLLAFLIFSGIYLMISLTASILREQVTS